MIPHRIFPRLGWPALAALVAALPYAGLALGWSALYHDDSLRFDVPMTSLINEALCRGRLPLWNPYVGVGTPLIIDVSALPVYPARILGCGLPAGQALGLLLLIQLGVLAAGATALLRDLGVLPALAAAAGAALALAGPAPSWLTSPAYLTSLSFFPWTLLFARRLASGQRLAPIGLGASVGLATLGGDVPGTLFATAVGLLVWWGACRARRRARASADASWRCDLLRLACAGGLALLIGSGSWVPLLWFLQRSVRGGGISPMEAGQWSLSPVDLIGLLLPNPRGLPLPEFTFWQFRTLGSERLFVHSLYVGATLAGFGLWGFWRERRDVFVRWAALAALLLVILATGAETPLWTVTHGIFTYFRYPSKLAPYAVILLGVVGALSLSHSLGDGRRLAQVAGAVAAFCTLGALLGPSVQAHFARGAGAPDDVVRRAGEALRLDGARAAAVAAAVLVLWWLARRRRVGGRALPVLLGGLLVLDSLLAGLDLHWTAPPAALSRPAWAPEVSPWGPRVLRSQVLDQNRLGLDAAAYRAEQMRKLAELLPSSNLSHHIGALFGYGLALADPAKRIAALYDADGVALAEATGCAVAMAPRTRRLAWAVAGMASGRLSLASLSPDAAIFSVVRRLPRAFLTTGARIVAPGTEATVLAAARERPAVIVTAGEALVHGQFTSVAIPSGDVLLGGPGEMVEVKPVNWLPERVRFDLVAPGPRLFVLLDAFAEGWRVSLDGAEAPILRVNSVGRGVIVAAGAHTLEMRFQPLALRLWPWISWLSLLAVAVAAVMVRRRSGQTERKPKDNRASAVSDVQPDRNSA
ncbi:MAG: hypothetical protein ACLP66_02345 [Polyangia bacterium]